MNLKISIFLFVIFTITGECSALHTSEYLQYIKNFVLDLTTRNKIDPDVVLTTPQLIRKEGYPAESHIVLTDDGYLLTLHRIPGNESSPAVFLQHGLLASSADWVISGRGKGLAYLLWDKGYDVWLGNFRGNTYSRAHISLTDTDPKFWDFSFHELALHDLPSMISYVAYLKNDTLAGYVGHSMGTTTFYIMASERQETAKLVQTMISLAPVAFMQHLTSPIRFVAPLIHDIELMAHLLGENEFLPQNSVLRFLAKYGCDIDVWEEKICANSIFAICGFDPAQFNYTLMPVILSHTPAGASTKTVLHYGQEIASGHFRQYDYGHKRNMEIYNSLEPPDYDLSKISVPIALFYADNDWLASPVDVMRLAKMLSSKIDVYRVPFPKFNHLDFTWGIDAPALVYKRIFYILDKYGRRY